MNLKSIADAVGGKLHIVGNNADIENKKVKQVVIDSRLVENDFVFIATKGERVDGHSFIDAVFEKGALGVICEKEPQNPKGSYIVVKDSFAALKDLATYYRSILDIKVVGVTGSVGKTSTKEFIASVLEKQYNTLKTNGNYNNEIGLPLTVLRIKRDCEVAVLEMGISDFGEMHRLSKIAKPDVCVITNIGQCHLENLGTRDGILKAKTEIFDYMAADGSVVLNGDDDKLITVNQKAPLFFGMNPDMYDKYAVYATDYINKGLIGSEVVIHINTHNRKENFKVNIPLPGEHMVYNALTATAVGVLFEMSADNIKAGLESVEPVGGRSHVIYTSKYTLIDDCYNANPVSMKAAIDLLGMTKTQKNTRNVAILGDMFELGENESELHREVGVYVADNHIDCVICIGELCKNMYDGITSVDNYSGKSYYYADKESMIKDIDNILADGDTILIKASNGMRFGEIREILENK